jgi:hypothetical protein
MKTIKLALLLFLFPTFIYAQDKLGGNYNFETECFGAELDGSITVKAWGNGRNRLDAVEQAKKSAVRDVIFKGIHNGKSDCSRSPILLEPNAQERHQEYFYGFFADNGPYKDFVSMKDERIFDKVKRDKKKARESVTHGVVIRVLVYEIKKKLIEDGIIKTK